MPDLVTIAGVTGPADTLPSKQYSDVTNVNIDLARQVVTLFHRGSVPPTELDLFGITTVTYTVATHLATISFS